MQRAQVIELSQIMMDAYNTGDWETFRRHLAPDVVYEEVGTGCRVEGPDAYIAVLQSWRQAMPDVHGTVTDTIVDGDSVAQQVTWRGTHQGALRMPGMTIPPTGRSGRTQAIMWSRLRDERLVHVCHHLDIMGFMQQLGLAGSPQVQHA